MSLSIKRAFASSYDLTPQVHTDRGTVEVLWDSGQKREFRWGSIVWGSVGQTTGSKPTAEGTYIRT